MSDVNHEANAIRSITRAMGTLTDGEAERVRHWFGEKYVHEMLLGKLVKQIISLKKELADLQPLNHEELSE